MTAFIGLRRWQQVVRGPCHLNDTLRGQKAAYGIQGLKEGHKGKNSSLKEAISSASCKKDTGSTSMLDRESKFQTSNPNASMHLEEEEQTHFGFRSIPKALKEGLVGQVFDAVAGRYDLMNDAMSLGIHRLWKTQLVRAIDPTPDMRVLDMAGGTGDIAFRLLKHLEEQYGPPLDDDVLFKDKPGSESTTTATSLPFEVIVMDINEQMLNMGKERVASYVSPQFQPCLSWQQGNAESVPSIASASIDCYSIAFGIRNCTDLTAVLREAYRVLKPGGVFYCLEFTPELRLPGVAQLYDLYSWHVIPRLGALLAGSAEPYQYFVESIRRHPSQEAFLQLMRSVGFRQASFKDLAPFGIAAIHSAIKL